MHWLVAYDIGDARRRRRISDLLRPWGPRVQKSVFEVRLDTQHEVRRLVGQLREVIEPGEDQIRLYPLDRAAIRHRVIVGARLLEEWQDFHVI